MNKEVDRRGGHKASQVALYYLNFSASLQLNEFAAPLTDQELDAHTCVALVLSNRQLDDSSLVLPLNA